jgi:hypothetical protein
VQIQIWVQSTLSPAPCNSATMEVASTKVTFYFSFLRVLSVTVKKKGSNGAGQKAGVNGMLAALHPSGTIHVGGSNNLNSGMMSTDFKMTMKHNSSNHSI